MISSNLTMPMTGCLKNLTRISQKRVNALRGELLKNSVNPADPLQAHFDQILDCLEESADITNLLIDPTIIRRRR